MSWVLYSRNDCHLCDAFEAELSGSLPEIKSACKKVDVDSSQELQALYGNDVPVLTFNEEIVCQHFFDKDKIIKALS